MRFGFTVSPLVWNGEECGKHVWISRDLGLNLRTVQQRASEATHKSRLEVETSWNLVQVVQ